MTSDEFEEFKKKRNAEDIRREIKEKQLMASKKRIAVNGFNYLLEKHKFDNFIAKEAWQERMLKIAKEYADSPNGWLLVSGQSGCGKTHLCTAVVNKMLEDRTPVMYMLWREDVSRIKSSSFNDQENSKGKLSIFKSVNCLYIDDFLKGGYTEADIKIAFELLDYRYKFNKLTIISTELTKDELMNADEAITGRIWQMSQRKIFVKKDSKRNIRIAGEI